MRLRLEDLCEFRVDGLIYKQVKYNTDHDDMNGYESSIQWETDHKVENNQWMIF